MSAIELGLHPSAGAKHDAVGFFIGLTNEEVTGYTTSHDCIRNNTTTTVITEHATDNEMILIKLDEPLNVMCSAVNSVPCTP